jgi:hypothetical protein
MITLFKELKMSTVTKMQMFEKMRQLSEKAQYNLLYMMRIFKEQGVYGFGGDKYITKTYGSNRKIHFFHISNAILGKLQREGLIQKSGVFVNRFYFYSLSQLLSEVKSEDYFVYLKNYEFYKNNSGHIQIMYEEQELSKEEYSHWIDCFYDSSSKQRFVRFKKLQKEKKANFLIGEEVSFTHKYDGHYRRRTGVIVKMNPTRAIVQEDIDEEYTQKWNCTYSSLDNFYITNGVKFISWEPIEIAA